MYQVYYTNRAVKSFKKVPRNYQIKIEEVIKKLATDPFSLDIKKLAAPNKASHRLRTGPYRIFLDIDTSSKEIIIVDIRRRTTQTYH